LGEFGVTFKVGLEVPKKFGGPYNLGKEPRVGKDFRDLKPFPNFSFVRALGSTGFSNSTRKFFTFQGILQRISPKFPGNKFP